jgi:methenyltetrahydromethanopterin cyclohydrolase
MTLNESAAAPLQALAALPGVTESHVAGARILDCTRGGLEAGRQLALVCLAGLGEVTFAAGELGNVLRVASESPVRACLASQYAGWAISVGKYFAMGSGPMRAAYGKEALYDDIGCRESPPMAVGVLETRKPPTPEAIAYIAERVKLPAEKLTLAFAPTASVAGTIQVVARSLETALHKLHELKFDLSRVVQGQGAAPIPAVAKDDLSAIGLTNDVILYGGEVTLWLTGDDASLREVGPRVPSSSSPSHGSRFADLLKAAGGDFYKLDPMLFSPAVVTLVNVDTGWSGTFGRMEPELVRQARGD